MTKLPEMRQLSDSSDQGVVYGYTKEQILQFRRDALGEALCICSDLSEIRGRGAFDCALAISKLMEAK